MRNIQTAVSSHQLKIGHMFIWTYLLGTVHTATSQNIHYSSWNTLCIYVIYIYIYIYLRILHLGIT